MLDSFLIALSAVTPFLIYLGLGFFAVRAKLATASFMQSLNKFDGRCRVDVWLCQIARNAYYSHCRRQKDKKHILPEIDSGQDMQNTILDQEQAMIIYAHLHELNEPYKEVFMLRLFGELEYSQIAKLFGKTESWARVTYHRAKMKLMESVKEDDAK